MSINCQKALKMARTLNKLFIVAAGEIPTAGPALPGAVTGITQASNISRQSRRLYVGNIPFGITEVRIKIFRNSYQQFSQSGINSVDDQHPIEY